MCGVDVCTLCVVFCESPPKGGERRNTNTLSTNDGPNSSPLGSTALSSSLVVSWVQVAVRLLAHDTAALFGLHDRGVLEVPPTH